MGRGRLTVSADIYEGYFQNGKPNGYCKVKWSDGTFEGQFVNGKMEGPGKLDTPSEFYEGNFKAD